MRTYAQQKAGLTSAVKSGDPNKVRAEVARTKAEWDSIEWEMAHGTPAWPDAWHRWNIALYDATREHIDDI